MSNHIEIFTKIYETCEWGNNNKKEYSGSSGGGSSLSYNSSYITFLKDFIQKNNINKIIDLGCGDWQFSHLIYNNLNIDYYGYDAYEKVIDHNKKKFSDYNFTHLNIIEDIDKIQDGDLCILKEILQHWTCKEIELFIDKLINLKKFKYILINNCSGQKYDNQDIPFRSRPLSIKFFPLKKYNPVHMLSYHRQEVSIITI